MNEKRLSERILMWQYERMNEEIKLYGRPWLLVPDIPIALFACALRMVGL
jgi:hypothetical protein